MKKQQLEIERMQFEAGKHAEIKHQFNQMADFAIRTLPWWNRSPKAIADRATEFLLMLKRETAKHVAMDVLASKIREEGQKDAEIVDKVVEKVAEVSGMDREGAEMEIK